MRLNLKTLSKQNVKNLSKLKQNLKNAIKIDLSQNIFYSIILQDNFQGNRKQ